MRVRPAEAEDEGGRRRQQQPFDQRAFGGVKRLKASSSWLIRI
jgi:hypothetical protein